MSHTKNNYKHRSLLGHSGRVIAMAFLLAPGGCKEASSVLGDADVAMMDMDVSMDASVGDSGDLGLDMGNDTNMDAGSFCNNLGTYNFSMNNVSLITPFTISEVAEDGGLNSIVVSMPRRPASAAYPAITVQNNSNYKISFQVNINTLANDTFVICTASDLFSCTGNPGGYEPYLTSQEVSANSLLTIVNWSDLNLSDNNIDITLGCSKN